MLASLLVLGRATRTTRLSPFRSRVAGRARLPDTRPRPSHDQTAGLALAADRGGRKDTGAHGVVSHSYLRSVSADPAWRRSSRAHERQLMRCICCASVPNRYWKLIQVVQGRAARRHDPSQPSSSLLASGGGLKPDEAGRAREGPRGPFAEPGNDYASGGDRGAASSSDRLLRHHGLQHAQDCSSNPTGRRRSSALRALGDNAPDSPLGSRRASRALLGSPRAAARHAVSCPLHRIVSPCILIRVTAFSAGLNSRCRLARWAPPVLFSDPRLATASVWAAAPLRRSPPSPPAMTIAREWLLAARAVRLAHGARAQATAAGSRSPSAARSSTRVTRLATLRRPRRGARVSRQPGLLGRRSLKSRFCSWTLIRASDRWCASFSLVTSEPNAAIPNRGKDQALPISPPDQRRGLPKWLASHSSATFDLASLSI